MAGPIRISVLANGTQANRAFASVSANAGGMGVRVRKAGKTAAIGLTALGVGGALALAKLGAASIKSASDAQQSAGATETVFGRYASRVVKDSRRASDAYGLSANEYRNNANLIGSLFKNQGVRSDELAGKTKNMIGTAADLAATFGGPTSKAVEALGSAFKGEFDPLEAYGISIKQSTINTEAMRVAQVKTTKDFNKLTTAQQTAAKQQAATNLINKQAASSSGAFSRETGTLAHQQQVLGAKLENIKTRIGAGLLPGLTALATTVNTQVLPPMSRLATKYAPQVSAAIASISFKNLKSGSANKDLSSIAGSVRELGPAFAKGAKSLPSFTDLLSVSATVIGVAADHTDLLIKALPFLAAGYVAVKAGQVAANAAQLISIPTKIAEVLINRQLVASNKLLIASRVESTVATTAQTGAENVGILTRTRSLAGLIAQKTATTAVAVATKAYTAGQWLLNVALTANPIGLVVVAIAALVAALVFAYRHSDRFRAIVDKTFGAIKKVVSGAISFVIGFVRSNFKLLPLLILGPLGVAVIAVIKNWDRIKAATSATWGALKGIVSGAVGKVMGVVTGIKGKVTGAFDGAKDWLLGIGGDIVSGLGRGIRDAGHLVEEAAQAIIDKIPKKIRQLMGIASPSKVMRRLARWLPAGLALGITDGTEGVERSVTAITKRIDKAFSSNLAAQKKNIGRKYDGIDDEIRAKHDKIEERLRRTLKGGELQTALRRNNKAEDQALSRADKARDKALAAAQKRTGKEQRQLLGLVHKQLPAIRANAKAQDAVAESLKTARDVLADMQKAQSDYAAQVRDTVVAAGSLSTLGQGTGFGSVGQLIAQRADVVTQTAKFVDVIGQLRGKLNDTDLQNLIDGGVGNLGTATAILNGGAGSIAQLNDLQAQLGALGTTLGQGAAQQFYGVGVAAQHGIVAGLEADAAKLDKAAVKLANTLVKAVKKALGIKSPSRVFKTIGVNSVRGLDIGLDDTYVKRSGATLAASLTKGFGTPALDAWVAAGGRPSDSGGGEVRFSAQEVDQLARGRSVTKDTDAWTGLRRPR